MYVVIVAYSTDGVNRDRKLSELTILLVVKLERISECLSFIYAIEKPLVVRKSGLYEALLVIIYNLKTSKSKYRLRDRHLPFFEWDLKCCRTYKS